MTSFSRRFERKQRKKGMKDFAVVRRPMPPDDPNHVQLYNTPTRLEDHIAPPSTEFTLEDLQRGAAKLENNNYRHHGLTDAERALCVKYGVLDTAMLRVELLLGRGAKLVTDEKSGELRVIIPSERFGTKPIPILRFPRPR